jgi:hypothetical protein
MTIEQSKAIQLNRDLISPNESLLIPKNLQDGMELAKVIANSDLAPKDYRGKPENVLIAVQMGLEVGLAPMQAIQNIAVINGRPCLWGDAMLALVQTSGKLEWIKEWAESDTSYCSTKRVGYPDPYTTSFSDADAKAAGLLGKVGPWTNYKSRMRQMRARAFNLRDQFADILKGLNSAEEVQDYEVSPPRSRGSVISMMPKRKSEVKKLVAEEFVPEESNPNPKPEVQAEPAQEIISEAQRKRLFSITNQARLPQEDLKKYLKNQYRIDSTKEIAKKDYEEICNWVEAQALPSGREPGEEG